MHLVEGNGHQEVAKGQRRHLWLSILQAWYAQQLLMSCHWARYRCQAHKQLHPACPLLSSCSQPIASIACTPWRPHCRRWSSELSHQEFQMSWQRSHGSRVTNLRLKVSRFHGWSLPYWLAPLPIAEILSHPGENSRAPRFSTCAERFPATDGMQQRPNWSRVETTYIYMEIKHIFGYTFSSHDDLLACCMASRPMIFCTKALLYIFQAVCVTKEMLICGKGVLVNLF